MHEVEVAPEGLRHLTRLPDKVHHAALASIFGPTAGNPQRLGKPLCLRTGLAAKVVRLRPLGIVRG